MNQDTAANLQSGVAGLNQINQQLYNQYCVQIQQNIQNQYQLALPQDLIDQIIQQSQLAVLSQLLQSQIQNQQQALIGMIPNRQIQYNEFNKNHSQLEERKINEFKPKNQTYQQQQAKKQQLSQQKFIKNQTRIINVDEFSDYELYDDSSNIIEYIAKEQQAEVYFDSSMYTQPGNYVKVKPQQIFFTPYTIPVYHKTTQYYSVPTLEGVECWRFLNMSGSDNLQSIIETYVTYSVRDSGTVTQEDAAVRDHIYSTLIAKMRGYPQTECLIKNSDLQVKSGIVTNAWVLTAEQFNSPQWRNEFCEKFSKRSNCSIGISVSNKMMYKTTVQGELVEDPPQYLIHGETVKKSKDMLMHVYILKSYFDKVATSVGHCRLTNKTTALITILGGNQNVQAQQQIQQEQQNSNQNQQSDQIVVQEGSQDTNSNSNLDMSNQSNKIDNITQTITVPISEPSIDHEYINQIYQLINDKVNNVPIIYKNTQLRYWIELIKKSTNYLKQGVTQLLNYPSDVYSPTDRIQSPNFTIQCYNKVPHVDFNQLPLFKHIEPTQVIQYLNESCPIYVVDNFINKPKQYYFTVFGSLSVQQGEWYLNDQRVNVVKIKYSNTIPTKQVIRIGYAVYVSSGYCNYLSYPISPQPIKVTTTINSTCQDRIIGCPDYLSDTITEMLYAVSGPSVPKNVPIYLNKLTSNLRARNIPTHLQDPYNELIDIVHHSYVYVLSKVAQTADAQLEVQRNTKKSIYKFMGYLVCSGYSLLTSAALMCRNNYLKNIPIINKNLSELSQFKYIKYWTGFCVFSYIGITVYNKWKRQDSDIIDYVAYQSNNNIRNDVIVGAAAIVQGHQDPTQYYDNYRTDIIRQFNIQKLKVEQLQCECASTQIRRPIQHSLTCTKEIIHSYTSCKYNGLSALLGRHAGGQLYPAEGVMLEFRDFVHNRTEFKDLLQYMSDAPILDCQEYLSYVQQHDTKKYKQYIRHHANLLQSKTSPTWDCFPKTNEYKVIPSDSQLTKPPRCIYSPPAHILVGGGTINYYIGKHIVKQDWSAIGLTPSEICEKIQTQINKYNDPVILTLDTSNFDRCQHLTLLRAVDHTLLLNSRIIDKLLLPQSILQYLYQDLVSGKISARIKVNRSMYLYFKVYGTVYSGNSFTATFNTLRDHLIVNFALRTINVPYSDICAGDDTKLFCSREHSILVQQTLRQFYSETDVGTHNLGQQVKEILIQEIDNFTFLSKDFISIGGQTHLYRDYIRVIEIQQSSKSFMPDHQIVQSTANNLATLLPLSYIQQILRQYPVPQQLTKLDFLVAGYDWYQQLYHSQVTKYEWIHDVYFDILHVQKQSGYFLHKLQLNKQPSNLDQTGSQKLSVYNQTFSQIIYLSSLSLGLQPILLYSQAPKNSKISAKPQVNQASSLQVNQFVNTQLTSSNDGLEDQYKYPNHSSQVQIGAAHIQIGTTKQQVVKTTYGKKKKVSAIKQILQARSDFKKNHPKASISDIINHLNQKYPNVFDAQRMYPKYVQGPVKSLNIKKTQGQNFGQVKITRTSNGKILIGTLDQVTETSGLDQQNCQLDQTVDQPMAQIGMETIKQRKNKAKYLQQQMGQKQTSKKPAMAYVESVLNPFNTVSIRAPNDFYQPTSLLDFKYEADWTPGTTNATILLYPQWFCQQIATNSTSWLNLLNYAPGSNISYGAGTVSLPNQVITHPLAGGNNVNASPTNYYSPDPTNTSTGRWTSARTVRCGIRIIPSANITVKQGTVTYGCIPGKTFNLVNMSSVSIPTVNQLRQYPTSYEAQLAGVGQEGIKYIWLPLDPMDSIFSSGSTVGVAASGSHVDAEFQTYATRSPIYALLSGISANDTFRVEVVTTVEYIPTLVFESWSPSKVSDLTSEVSKNLSKFFGNNIFESVTGKLGDMIVGDPYSTGQLITKLIPYIGHLM